MGGNMTKVLGIKSQWYLSSSYRNFKIAFVTKNHFSSGPRTVDDLGDNFNNIFAIFYINFDDMEVWKYF